MSSESNGAADFADRRARDADWISRWMIGVDDTGSLAGLRDRALLSVMLYSFARVNAVLGIRRQDYLGQGSRG